MSIRSFIPRNNVFNNVVPCSKSKYNHVVSPESQEDGAEKNKVALKSRFQFLTIPEQLAMVSALHLDMV